MTKSILLDTNVLLAKILPNDTWKMVIDEFFKDLTKLVKEQENLEINITSFIRKEIANKIKEITTFLNLELRTIASGYLYSGRVINRELIMELQGRFNAAIISQQDEKTRERNRRLLMEFENHLLREVKNNPTKHLGEHLINTLDTLNGFEVQLQNSVEQLLLAYKIKKLAFPREEQKKQRILEIEQDLPMTNDADKKILSFFLFHLEQSNIEGVFITHDFGDFHVYASTLQAHFKLLTILRPSYLSCFYFS